MSLKSSIDNLKFDARMIEINIKNQSISREDLTKYLSKLPDMSEMVLPVELDSRDADIELNGADHNSR